MNKKPLQINSISNELAGASLFFTPQGHSPSPSSTPDEQIRTPIPAEPIRPVEIEVKKEENHTSKQNSNIASLPSDMKANKDANTAASKLASEPSENSYDPIETIRKTVRQVGKESVYIRLTPIEKEQINSTIYAINGLYHREGNNKFTANELGRIAINSLLEDFQANREQSTLAKVLDALKA